MFPRLPGDADQSTRTLHNMLCGGGAAPCVYADTDTHTARNTKKVSPFAKKVPHTLPSPLVDGPSRSDHHGLTEKMYKNKTKNVCNSVTQTIKHVPNAIGARGEHAGLRVDLKPQPQFTAAGDRASIHALAQLG